MIPSKYVPKQLEFLFFPNKRDFCHVYVVAFGMAPYNVFRLRSVGECWGSFENATNAFHLERIQFVHLILGQLYGFKSVHELGYED